MDCSKLIQLFEKVEGVLTCDNNKENGWVNNTNLKC